MKNSTIKIFFHFFLLFAFLAGIYVCLTNGIINTEINSSKEGIEEKNSTESNCPDLLIKRGNTLLLYNSKLPEVDGSNPLPFNSLDEYINYLEIQRKKGIRCPVLFLQQENDTQGNDVYRMRPSPFYLEGGLPPLPIQTQPNIQTALDASRENPPYNSNNYAGFDPYGQYVGQNTNIDQIHNSTRTVNSISENPMDPNWGGIKTTQDAVDSGKYKENEIRPAMYPTIIPR